MVDFSLSDEERQIRDTVRSFIEKEVMPLEPEVLRNERAGQPGLDRSVLRDLQAKARRSGFWGVNTPEEYGGMNLGAVMSAILMMETGRTCCGGGFNLQNLPRESDESEAARTIRGCFVACEGNVLIDSDYSQIELVVLAHALGHQFGYPSHLAGVINGGQDVHKLIAAAVLGKPVADVTKDERASVKPISFGRPGGMGPDRLRQMARQTHDNY